MRLLIHAGLHKTGTSALQAFCRMNRAQLASQGVLYPQEGSATIRYPASPTAEAGHRRLEIVFGSPTNRASRNKIEAILKEAASYGSVDTIVISSETFAAPKINISSAVYETLRAYFSEISVFFYLRRQDDWADSLYREVLCWSRRREQDSFEQFYSNFLSEWLDFEARLQKWTDVFGLQNMCVRSFDDRRHEDVIVDFFAEAGLPLPPNGKCVYPENTNVSLPYDLIPLMLEINELELGPQQRSVLTQRIYRELSESDFRVDRVALLEERHRNDFRDRFQAMNRRICELYQTGNSRYFCFEIDRPGRAQETSLAPDRVDRIRELSIQAVNQKPETADGKPPPNRGQAGISCLLSESPEQVKLFVRYHLAVGFSRIRLYFDNPDDPMADYDYGTERVEVIRCTPEFWNTRAGMTPDTNDDKLYICHEDGLNYLNSREDIDWAINIDSDELVYLKPGIDLQSYLRRIPSRYDQVRICPLENIFVSDADMELFSARYFKLPRSGFFERGNKSKTSPRGIVLFLLYRMARLLSGSRLFRQCILRFSKTLGIYFIWCSADEDLYRKYMPRLAEVMRQGFLGHRQGRTFTRKGVVLDQMSSHVQGSSLRKLVTRRFGNKIFLLHYDAASFSAWHYKWHRRTHGETIANVIGGDRQKQQDMFLEAVEHGEDAVKELFYGFFRLPEAAVGEFEKSGLIVRLDNPVLEKVRKEVEGNRAEPQG